jgi:S-formylglutathione hydrolase FrmB
MKKIILFILFSTNLFAQNASKIEEGKMTSKILGKDVKFNIYLPAGYDAASTRKYPVVYLLHGYSDDETGWVQFGEIDRLADKAITDGAMPQMIIVMPDGGVSFYINSYDGKEKYEDFFIKEFMPNIEKTYKIKAEKKYRGIAGLSMGGYGSLTLALRNPDLFAACAPLSAAIWTDEDILLPPDNRREEMFESLYGRGLKGKDRLTKNWYENSPLKIIETKSAEELKKVRYWIDCGDDDFLIKGNCLLKLALSQKNIPHEFRIRDGAHNWTYWRTGIIDALGFIGDSFRQK